MDVPCDGTRERAGSRRPGAGRQRRRRRPPLWGRSRRLLGAGEDGLIPIRPAESTGHVAELPEHASTLSTILCSILYYGTTPLLVCMYKCINVNCANT